MAVTEEPLVRLEESLSHALQRFEATRAGNGRLRQEIEQLKNVWRSLKRRISGTVR